MLLKAGSDHTIYRPTSNSRLIHLMVGEKVRRGALWTPQQKADYQELVEWLEDRGESIETATADIARWKSWNAASGEYRRNIDAEIAERVRRDAKEKKAGQKVPAGNDATP